MPTSATLYLRRGKATTTNADGGGGGGGGLPQVQPVSAQAVHNRFGINTVPNGGTTVYQKDSTGVTNQTVWTNRVQTWGVTYIRGLFDENNANCLALAAMCRAKGIGWLMEVVDEGSTSPTTRTVTQTTARVNYIADNWADICLGIEGLNEPNTNRGDGSTTTGWQNTAYDHQAAIWAACKGARNVSVLGSKPILGPSLNDKHVNSSGGVDYKILAATGIAMKMDYLGVHKYPNGGLPESGMDTTFGWIDQWFGAAQKRWLTETGYTNAIHRPSGHNPVSTTASGIYAPRSLYGVCAARGLPMTWFELLDDVNSAKDNTESNFGLVAVTATQVSGTTPSQWTDKAAATALAAELEDLNDPGATYIPALVGLQVATTATDLRYVVLGWRNGTVKVKLWREKSVYTWNQATLSGTDVSVSTVSVTVTDQVGARTVTVGASVTSLTLR